MLESLPEELISSDRTSHSNPDSDSVSQGSKCMSINGKEAVKISRDKLSSVKKDNSTGDLRRIGAGLARMVGSGLLCSLFFALFAGLIVLFDTYYHIAIVEDIARRFRAYIRLRWKSLGTPYWH